MNLNVPLYHSVTPSPAHREIQQQQDYLVRVRESLSWIMGSMQANAREVAEKYVKKEQCERLLQEKDQMIAKLQSENYQLRVGSEQYQRYLKRYEMKHELLNNRVHHLTKALNEKDAIIKYLEGKTLPTLHPPQPDSRRINDSLQERTYSKSNLSFAKMRSTSNLMTFEDYANCSLQLPKDPLKVRNDRARTESSDVKQNQCTDNIKPSGTVNNKMNSFFSTSMFGSFQNQKTLTKTHSTVPNQNVSFCQYSKPKPQVRQGRQGRQGRQQRRHSNFGASYMPPTSFYRE